MEKYDCGFTKENNWFRYRAAAIIIENDCVFFAGIEHIISDERFSSQLRHYKIKVLL